MRTIEENTAKMNAMNEEILQAAIKAGPSALADILRETNSMLASEMKRSNGLRSEVGRLHALLAWVRDVTQGVATGAGGGGDALNTLCDIHEKILAEVK